MSLQRIRTVIVLSSLLVAGFTACSDEVKSPSLAGPKLRSETADERAESVEALQTAWRERPRETTETNRRTELRFLKSLGRYVNRIKDTSEFTRAGNVWNDCVRDHTQQYGAPER